MRELKFVGKGTTGRRPHERHSEFPLCRPQLGATLNVIASAHVGQLRLARSDQQAQLGSHWLRNANAIRGATDQLEGKTCGQGSNGCSPKCQAPGKCNCCFPHLRIWRLDGLGLGWAKVGDRVGEAQALKSLATAFLNYGNAAEARGGSNVFGNGSIDSVEGCVGSTQRSSHQPSVIFDLSLLERASERGPNRHEQKQSWRSRLPRLQFILVAFGLLHASPPVICRKLATSRSRAKICCLWPRQRSMRTRLARSDHCYIVNLNSFCCHRRKALAWRECRRSC